MGLFNSGKVMLEKLLIDGCTTDDFQCRWYTEPAASPTFTTIPGSAMSLANVS